MNEAYYTYGYPDDVPLISVWSQLLDKIENTHIDIDMNAIENTIRETISETCGDCSKCEHATKTDIDNAVCEINNHIDAKLDAIDFPSMFADLNEQVRNCCCNH